MSYPSETFLGSCVPSWRWRFVCKLWATLIADFPYRERKEEEERKRLGEDAPPDEDEEDIITGDPFKAVTKEYLDEKVNR